MTSGLILSVDLVNTEINCFKGIFALDLASMSIFLLLFNGDIYTSIVLSFAFCVTPERFCIVLV